MKIKKDKELDETKKLWYDFELKNKEELIKLELYLTTMSKDFTISTRIKENKIIGYCITEIEIKEEIIKKWYDEIEGGENNMHETTN